MDLPKLLGPRLQDAELLLNRVNLLKRSGELGPPEALHLLEGFNEGGELTGPGLTEGSFKLQLESGCLEVPDKVSCGLS